MIKKIILLLNALLLVSLIYPQIPNQTDQKIVDSLFLLLPEAKGNAKVDILNQLALNLAPQSYDSSYQFASEALHLSEELDYQKGKGIAIFNIGNCYYFTADYKSALLNYLQALRFLETFKPHKELADLLFMLAALNRYVNNLEKSQYYYLLSVKNYFEINDSAMAMKVYQYLSGSYFQKLCAIANADTSLYRKLTNPMLDSAIKYTHIAVDYYLQHPGEKPGKGSVEDLANAYNLLGGWYLTKTDTAGYSMGIESLLKGLEASHEIKNIKYRKELEGSCYINLGANYYYVIKDYKKGIEYAKIGAETVKETESVDIYAFVLWMLGDIEREKGNYSLSEQYLKLALNMSDTFLLMVDTINVFNDPTFRLYAEMNMRRIRCDILYTLLLLHKAMGDFESALIFRKKLEDEREILKKDETNREITGLQVNFEDELQNQQIAMVSKEKELAKLRLSRARLWFAGGGSVGIIVFLLIFLYFQRKKYSTEQNALLLKQRLLRSQMNPHFIFNSLAGIQNFIVTSKPDKASIYLSKFATLVRNILDSSVKEYITLEKEVSTIENYLELQKVRYAGKFEFTIRVDDALDPETTMIPPMLAQPFIENAIEHGIIHSEKMGLIDVGFRLEHDVLLFEVRDNGVGREKARELEAGFEKDHSSMSTAITLERLAMLNKKRKHKIIFEITDLKDAEGNPAGTHVKFGIPLRH